MRATRVLVVAGSAVLSLSNAKTLSTELPESFIGELFTVAVYPSQGKRHWRAMVDTINKYKIGSAIIFGGTVEEVAECIRYLRTHVGHRLLIAMDVEWGVAMRVKEVPALPKAIALAAVRDSFLVRLAGWLTGYQCRLLDVDVALAPVVDVSSNMDNPVIGVRSWGSSPEQVARATGWFVEGLHRAGVIACIKHFPGHGDTYEDSHQQLAVVRAPRRLLDSIHLHPFRHHIARGIKMVMVGHIWVPALDSIPRSAVFSPAVVRKVLREELGYKGVVISDAFNMGGLGTIDRNEAVVQALAAGIDLILMPEDVGAAWRCVLSAIREGRLDREELYRSALRVRQLKNSHQPTARLLPPDSLRALLSAPWVEWAISKMAENSLIALGGCPPPITDQQIVIVGKAPELVSTLVSHHRIIQMEWQAPDTTKVSGEFILVVVPEASNFAGTQFATTTPKVIDAVSALARRATLVVVIGSPFWLRWWRHWGMPLLVAPGGGRAFELAVVGALRGEVPLRGELPLEFPGLHHHNTIACQARTAVRANQTPATIERQWLADTLSMSIRTAIDTGAFPGCQILIVHQGNVIFEGSFGTIAGKGTPPVTNTTLYDLASVTKAMSTTLAIMKLYEEGRIALSDTAGKWLPWLRGTPVARRTIEELLTHRAGLPAWVPFWRRFTPDTLELFFCSEEDSSFSIWVSMGLYAHRSVIDSLIVMMRNLPMDSAGSYRYSDLGFVVVGWIVESVSGRRLDSFVAETFYHPLGLTRTLYLPLREFDTSQIAPTEIDTYFRHSIVWGTVHDPLAALMGGVAGHAGLFSTAKELAILGQTILNGGAYQGRRVLADSTVRRFTWWRLPSMRRAIGFDHPSTGVEETSSGCVYAYPLAVGHLGFTGTAVWIDPYYELVFVFLSNRTYPSMWANRGAQVRKQLHCLAYQSLRVLLPQEALQALY